MKKTLFILCALLLSAVGASAQTPYEFHAEDWIRNNSRTLDSSIQYNEDNTITVTATDNENASGVYTYNISLGNNWQTSYPADAAYITTNGYYITSSQTYFVIVGKDLSTTETDVSPLWWLNGVNDNTVAETPTTLSDGTVIIYYNISSVITSTGNTTLDGGTCFGLTSTDETSHKSTISYIGFCDEEELEKIKGGELPMAEYTHACTANRNVWTVSPETYDTWVWLDTNAAKEDGSGMAPPALSYYTTDGEKLPDATITHETIEGLTPGVYEVSMLIRIIDYDTNEDGTYFTLGPGTTFNATTGTNNAVSQDIYLGVNAHDGSYAEADQSYHEDLYGTYTLYVTVESDNGGDTGSLTVSLDIKEATYNWIMFKNLKVKSLGTNATPVTVEGTMGADYGTLILPFDAELSSGSTSTLTAYTAGGVEDDVLTLTQVDDGKLTAGTPYIIGGTSGNTYKFSGVPTKYEVSYTDANNLLVGTLVDMDYDDFAANSTEYVLQNHTETDGGGLAFYPIVSGSSSDVTLGAYHCYLTLDSSTYPSGVRAFISLPGSDEATAIKAIEGAEAEGNGAIYDLSGRKVSKAVKGVYIQNGKKVLVK